jgi:hypothetical protein
MEDEYLYVRSGYYFAIVLDRGLFATKSFKRAINTAWKSCWLEFLSREEQSLCFISQGSAHFITNRPKYHHPTTQPSSDSMLSSSSIVSGNNATKQVQDLSGDDENIIKVIINGHHEKMFSMDWLTGNGRAADSILAMQLLGTKEGFQGTCELRLDESLVPTVDLLILWLTMGDDSLKSNLTQENASKIHALAQYFCLKRLEDAIVKEEEDRDETGYFFDNEMRRCVKKACYKFIQDSETIDELLLSLDEIPGTKYYGSRVVALICERYMNGCDDNHERAAIKSMLAVMVQKKMLSPSGVKNGMPKLEIFVNLYARNQLDHLGDLLATMIKAKAVDLNWICEQGVGNSMAFMQSLASSMKNTLGVDETKRLGSQCRYF